MDIVKKELSFEQLMGIYNHIGEQEKHFNNLEMEYRKLASQWLLVALGAVGFVLTKQELVPINVWVLAMGICVAASVGILVLWMMDIKVYHELLHAAFTEGVSLENEFPKILPQIRNNMIHSQRSGDVIKKVILFYFFSILLLICIANIAVWMFGGIGEWYCALVNASSLAALLLVYRLMTDKAERKFSLKR